MPASVPIRSPAVGRHLTARPQAGRHRRGRPRISDTRLLFMPDHFGDQLAPVPALMAAADATTSLRIGALVHDNDYKHPVVLAKELATLDVLSGGRLEIGLGAGWMRTDYEESGIAYDPPSVRVDRFEEGCGDHHRSPRDRRPVLVRRRHYKVTGASSPPEAGAEPRPPLIIGGGGKRVLGIAGAPGGHREHQRQPEGRDGRARGRFRTPPRRRPARRSNGCARLQATASTRSSSTVSIGFVLETDDRQSIIDAMAPAIGTRPDRRAARAPRSDRHDRADGRGAALEARELRALVLLVRELVLGGHRRSRRPAGGVVTSGSCSDRRSDGRQEGGRDRRELGHRPCYCRRPVQDGGGRAHHRPRFWHAVQPRPKRSARTSGANPSSCCSTSAASLRFAQEQARSLNAPVASTSS